MTFSNEFQFFDRIRLGTNGPLWSLSYEAAYYALFAAVFFYRGTRKSIIVAALMVLVGLPVLLLMPAWLMGVFVWQSLRDDRNSPQTTGAAYVLAIGAPIVYVVCIAINLPDLLLALTASALGVSDARQVLGYSDEFIWNAMIGALTSAHILGLARLWRSHNRDIRWIRWCAGASFSIYVTHYPTLHLLHVILPDPMFGRYTVLLVGSLAVGFAFAAVFERNLKAMRRAVMRVNPIRT